jgi:ABC-type sugar transport system ATPase subunit
VREDGNVSIGDSDLHIPMPTESKLPSDFRIGIRPENIKPDPTGIFAGELILTEPLGAETILHIQSGQRKLLSLVSGMTEYQIGDVIKFNIAFEHILYFNLQGDRLQI